MSNSKLLHLMFRSMNYLFSICIGSTSFEMFYSCKALPRNFIGLTLIKSRLYIIANFPFN